MKKYFRPKKDYPVKSRDVWIVFGIYMFFAFLYHVTLWINRSGYSNPEDDLFEFSEFISRGGMQYMVFFLLTIPTWFIFFRLIRHWKLQNRLLFHLVTMPIFVLIAQQGYYALSDVFGLWHLSGGGQIWDIYIPALIYMIQFGIFHGYEYFIENQRKLKLEGELRQAALKSELSAIKAQLNPHFLYNIFNTINASLPAENEKTRQMIAKLSDLFRYQLRASQEELVLLEEELDFVQKYLELEKARFGDRLAIKINVPKALYKEKIPPMLLQPLVENSVKHGLSSIIEGGQISISIFKKADKLYFEIADTGVGVNDTNSVFNKGIGLTNTRMRLQKMYQSALVVENNSPQGLKVTFAI